MSVKEIFVVFIFVLISSVRRNVSFSSHSFIALFSLSNDYARENTQKRKCSCLNDLFSMLLLFRYILLVITIFPYLLGRPTKG